MRVRVSSPAPERNDMDHFYVYYQHEGDWVYERTCGVIWAAQARIYELLQYYPCALFKKNAILEGAFY